MTRPTVPPVKPPRTKGHRDALALERVLSSRPPCRAQVLSEPEKDVLRKTLLLPPPAFTDEQAWLLARAFEPGVPLTLAVVSSLYEALDLPVSERPVRLVAERLNPNPVPPRASLLRRIVTNAGRTEPWTVDTVLQLFRTRRLTSSLSGLSDVLERLQIEAADVDSATMDKILSTINGRIVSFADITEIVAALGLELNFAQHLEVGIIATRTRVRANKARPLQGPDIDRIEAALGLTLPTSPAVMDVARALGMNPSVRSARAAARILRQRRPKAKPMALNTKTKALLDLMAERTGLEKSMVIDHALMTVAKMMVHTGSAKFPPDLRQHLVRETVLAQFRLLPPEECPPTPPAIPDGAKTRAGLVRSGPAAVGDGQPVNA